MPPPKVKVGTVIAGRYRLVAPLSRGGMGSVWRAEHLSLGSPIAIKLIDSNLVEHDEPRARFEQEARAAAALRSPNVVQILDHGVDKGLPFIAMELLEGESLAARLHRAGTISGLELVRIFQDIARAIKKAHDLGIIHRDLKPDNIFLVKNEDQEVAKILDFGIAKAQNPMGEWKGGTRTGALIGTPQYMSPEQAQALPIDRSTDLWALGVIAYECLCGVLPFPSDRPGELILQICARPMPVPSQFGRVPPRFDAWFARACQRDPKARFASVKELVDGLADVLGVAPVSIDATGSFKPLDALASMPVGMQLIAPAPVAALPPPAPPASSPTAIMAPAAPPAPRPPPPPAPVATVPMPPAVSSPGPAASAYGPGGTQVPMQAAPPPGPPPGGTMSGGAVVDSDPATLVVVPASRGRKAALAAVAIACVAAIILVGLIMSGEPKPAPAGPESTTPAVFPSSVKPTSSAPEPAPSASSSAPGSASAEPSSSASAEPSSSASSAVSQGPSPRTSGSSGTKTAPTGARTSAPVRPTATSSSTVTNSRIGF